MGIVLEPFRWLLRIVGRAANKFWWDDCFSRASSLAYTTLFALVPVTALTFSIFIGFNFGRGELEKMPGKLTYDPAVVEDYRLEGGRIGDQPFPDPEVRRSQRLSEAALERQIDKILEQVLPPQQNELLVKLKQEVFKFLLQLAKSVRDLGAASVFILIITGIALLNTIESALNAVWRVSSNMSIVSKIISFWAVITFGPILIGVSFYWYGRFGMTARADALIGPWFDAVVDFLIPIVSIWLALTLLFYKFPAAKVALRDAMLGALIAAVLFEGMKRGFAFYVGMSATYSSFYGVLVTIPLFLFWIYLIWVVILFGAEISYQAGSTEILHGLRKYSSELGEMGALLGLKILYVIGEKFLKGEAPPSESEIVVQTGSDPVHIRTCLEILTDAGLISMADADNHARTLVLSPSKISFGSVFKAFHSKRYLKHEVSERTAEELGVFLNTVRETSLRTDVNRPVSEWTLAEMLGSTR